MVVFIDREKRDRASNGIDITLSKIKISGIFID